MANVHCDILYISGKIFDPMTPLMMHGSLTCL